MVVVGGVERTPRRAFLVGSREPSAATSGQCYPASTQKKVTRPSYPDRPDRSGELNNAIIDPPPLRSN